MGEVMTATTPTDTPQDAPAAAAPTDSVKLSPIARFTPNEMRAVKAETGLSLTELMADEINGMQLLVWVTSRRDGKPITWAQAGDTEAEFEAPATAPDPTNGDSSMSEPPSAATSASPPPTSTP